MPELAPIEAQQFGWANSNGTGAGPDAITSGLEVVWSKTPTLWSNDYLHSLLENTWTKQVGPGGNWQWIALNGTQDYPDAFSNTTKHLPRMMTSDIALREDPVYYNICKQWENDFDGLTTAFKYAWYVSSFPWPLGLFHCCTSCSVAVKLLEDCANSSIQVQTHPP